MALIKIGKPEVAPENSALDMCSVCWWPDVREKEDSQRAAAEQWLTTGQDDNQEVQSHRNEGRKVPRSSYQQCLMLLTADKEKFSQRKKASPRDKANQKAQAPCRWRRISKRSKAPTMTHFPPRVALLVTTLDDNKLDDFTPTPKSWFFGQVSMGMAASMAKRSKTVLSERKREHTFSN